MFTTSIPPSPVGRNADHDMRGMPLAMAAGAAAVT